MVGKRDNIARLTHRATRLRFELHDISQSKDRKTQSSSRRHYCC
ncbi:PTS transporter subunit EIIB [Paenibacillus sp. FSL R5-0473]